MIHPRMVFLTLAIGCAEPAESPPCQPGPASECAPCPAPVEPACAPCAIVEGAAPATPEARALTPDASAPTDGPMAMLERVLAAGDGDSRVRAPNALPMLALAAAVIVWESRDDASEAPMPAALERLVSAIATNARVGPPPAEGGCLAPPETPLTPDLAACCGGRLDLDRDNRCDADPNRWMQEPWRSLGFTATPSEGAFSVRSRTTGSRTVVTVSARTDDDCDGTHTATDRRLVLTRLPDGGCEVVLEPGAIVTQDRQ